MRYGKFFLLLLAYFDLSELIRRNLLQHCLVLPQHVVEVS
jgi:hypothetical protein